MIPDAELISLLCSLLTKLDVGEFTVKVGSVHIPLCADLNSKGLPDQSPKDSGRYFRSLRCSTREDSYNLVGSRQAR
jgi:histidyl-tRNA synthetase